MRRLSPALGLFLAALAGPASADLVGPREGLRPLPPLALPHPRPDQKPQAFVVLNGERTEVRWSDGDSFKVKSGPYRGRGTRLVGYNTLESYGPVHRWGEWTPEALHALAKAAGPWAAAGTWTCTTEGEADGYGRLLVLCPDLAQAMVRQGYALAYAVEGGAPLPGLLELQAEAMQAGRGIWARGRVHGVVTSVHSLGEDGATGPRAYNRVVDTRTGVAAKRAHEKTYATCEWVCEETDGQSSCMRYVPFTQRYRNKPDCLRATAKGR